MVSVASPSALTTSNTRSQGDASFAYRQPRNSSHRRRSRRQSQSHVLIEDATISMDGGYRCWPETQAWSNEVARC